MHRREERRSSHGDRRFGFGRRMVDDRRELELEVNHERRSGERRTGEERREKVDRRASVRRLTRDPA